MSTAIQLTGGTIITLAGRNALRDAELTGSIPQPKYYRVSANDYPLDPAMTTADFHGWYTHEINAYVPVDDDTAQFTVRIPEDEATSDMLTVGIFLEDGTLFGLAKPDYAMPRGITQMFHILHAYDDISELLDFRYIPIEELDQHASTIHQAIVLGDMVLKQTARQHKIVALNGTNIR